MNKIKKWKVQKNKQKNKKKKVLGLFYKLQKNNKKIKLIMRFS